MTEILHGLIVVKIKFLINEKNETFKNFYHDRNNICVRRQLKFMQKSLIDLIETSKQKYYCKMNNKLFDTRKSLNIYWSLLEGF